MNWERPDWEKLYHLLLYEVNPHNFVDKRTHREAHVDTMAEARFLRLAFNDRYEQQRNVHGSDEALDRFSRLKEQAWGKGCPACGSSNIDHDHNIHQQRDEHHCRSCRHVWADDPTEPAG